MIWPKKILLPVTRPTLKTCTDLPTLNFLFRIYLNIKRYYRKTFKNFHGKFQNCPSNVRHLRGNENEAIQLTTWQTCQTEKSELNFIIWILSDSFFLVWVLFMPTLTDSRSILMHSLYESIIILPSICFFLSSTDSSTDFWVHGWLFSIQSK